MDAKLLLKLKSVYLSLPGFLQRPIDNVMFRHDIQIALKQFLQKDEYENTKLREEITKDILLCRKKYQIKAGEYFLFGFRGLSPQQRGEYLPDRIKDSVLSRIVGLDVMNREMKDKYNFYKLLGQYFKREAMLIPVGGGDLIAFKQFASRHTELFIKANLLSKGRNAGLYRVSSDEEATKLYHELVNAGIDWIVEEKIVQRKETAQWNDSSVNTVRLPAVLNEGKWTPIGPFFRTGRKGQAVDNAGNGGIFACIDAQTGVITTDGIDEHGVYFEKHPDSGLTYKGWQIPEWKKLLTLAEEIHHQIPHHKYVGWDFALTDKGWVLIEGNWGQFVSQYNDHIGLKNRFFELLGIAEEQ